MCIESSYPQKSNLAKFTGYFLIIVFAIFSGWSDFTFLHSLGAGISEIFMRLFKAISLPLIALSLIVTICDKGLGGKHKAIWKKRCFILFLLLFWHH